MSTGVIYRIFNIQNQKSYIGKTYSCVYRRLQDHIYKSRVERHRPLYAAFNKHGLDAFSFEILGEFPENLLEEKEQEFIVKFNSFGSGGYNATRGGDGTRYLEVSDEEVISSYLTTRVVKDTARILGIDAKTVSSILRRHEVDILPSKQAMLKKSKSILFRDKHFEHAQSCAQYLLDNNIIKSSAQLRSIANKIQEVCKGTRQSYMGLVFEYAPISIEK